MTPLETAKNNPSDIITLFIVITGLSSGGTERHLLQILPPLIKRGYQITIVNLSKKHRTLEPLFQKHSIKVITPPYPENTTRIRKIISSILFLKKNIGILKAQNSIIHSFLPAAYTLTSIALLLSRNHTLSHIMSRRSLNYYQRKYPCFRKLETFFHTKANSIFVNSIAIENQLINQENVPPEKITRIYNGIDLSHFTTPAYALDQQTKQNIRNALSLSLPKDTLLLCIVANLIPYKGHHDLIDALQKCKEQLPNNWHLLIIGRDDGIGNALQNTINQYGLKDHIQFLGSRDDIPTLLQASDIGLLTSHEEGFSNAVIEGMAAGLPMIVTDVGGNAEAVLHEQCGLVVPAHNPDALAHAITLLSVAPDIRKKYGQTSQKRTQQLYALETCVNHYDQAYKAIIHASPKTP